MEKHTPNYEEKSTTYTTPDHDEGNPDVGATDSQIAKNPIGQHGMVQVPPKAVVTPPSELGDDGVQKIDACHENPVAAANDCQYPVPTPTESSDIIGAVPSDHHVLQSEEWEMVDEGGLSSSKKGFVAVGRAVSIVAASDTIIKIALDRLTPHRQNKKLFGENSPDEIKVLAGSLSEVGQLVPIIVTPNLKKVGFYTILSGHKRADALRSLDRGEAFCHVVDIKDPDERLAYLLEANQQHIPNTVQKIRIGEAYFELETRKAGTRRVAGAKNKKGSKPVETFSQPGEGGETNDDVAGKARDLAAAKVHLCGLSLEHGMKAIKAAEKAEQDGHKETAMELYRLLNEHGIDPAYKQAKVLGLIASTSKGNRTSSKPKGDSASENNSGGPLPPPDSSSTSASQDPAISPPEQAVVDVGGSGAGSLSHNVLVLQQPGNVPLATITDDGDPPVVAAITASTKLLDQLVELPLGNLSVDQGGNLCRVLDQIGQWRASNSDALQGFQD